MLPTGEDQGVRLNIQGEWDGERGDHEFPQAIGDFAMAGSPAPLFGPRWAEWGLGENWLSPWGRAKSRPPLWWTLTRLRLKVFQVDFILVFVDVLVSAHHHNGEFELQTEVQKQCEPTGTTGQDRTAQPSQPQSRGVAP